MKIIFFGLGSIGSRHARLIRDNFNQELYAYRSGRKGNKLGIKEIYNLKEIDKIRPDIAFITNPTNKHVEYATYCARKGINLFIEKPLSNSKKGLTNLSKIARKNKIKIYIAYCLRHHPAIIWLKKHLKKDKPIHVSVYVSSYLPNWRRNTDYRKHYSAFKGKGGGVIFELSHELDYLYNLFGDVIDIKMNSKKISNLTADAEDFADILLEFKSGLICNLHLNFFSRLSRREIIIDFKDYTIVVDLVANNIKIYKDKNQKKIDLNLGKDDIYKAQLKYFFNNLHKHKMMNDLTESLKVFDFIMRVAK